jgi:hypothetical protein
MKRFHPCAKTIVLSEVDRYQGSRDRKKSHDYGYFFGIDEISNLSFL